MGAAINVALFLGNTECFFSQKLPSLISARYLKSPHLSLIPILECCMLHLRTLYVMQQNNIPEFHKAIPTHISSAHHSTVGSFTNYTPS